MVGIDCLCCAESTFVSPMGFQCDSQRDDMAHQRRVSRSPGTRLLTGRALCALQPSCLPLQACPTQRMDERHRCDYQGYHGQQRRVRWVGVGGRDRGNGSGNETYSLLHRDRLNTTRKVTSVLTSKSNEWSETGVNGEYGIGKGKRCTYNLLSLLGLPLFGVLTLKSERVLDSSTSLSGSGTNIASASAAGGGDHLVWVVSLSSLDKQEGKGKDRLNEPLRVDLRARVLERG